MMLKDFAIQLRKQLKHWVGKKLEDFKATAEAIESVFKLFRGTTTTNCLTYRDKTYHKIKKAMNN